ncbi:phosphate signaling complex protein PhoU [Thalassobacter stenotrophicus]|uniref:Phosphate-specific transport system accessory protein PhoU n=2 Tax=Thalassobacter stenotrophicus TaxID=266809 RepID=A0A0P1EWM3_9RHOB|nr:phosphate signaling complex protein PhoU [Thalassobacter stenotrophicus]CUH59411.1 Negative regulator of Pho regulon [Thalassobacter stenotrophicus]SHI84243.1 phosphate uptake regulator, PhoU [Thalassobacter stenotrophicus DSM 16310]
MVEQEHIASVFDRDLEAIQAMIMKMGGLVEQSIDQSITALVNRDSELALAVRSADKTIDALEEQVSTEAARVIALRAPQASDLRTVLSVFRIAANLERIGDYSKNIARRTGVVLEHDRIDGSSEALRRMARSVEMMLKDVLDAYIQRDPDLALDVRARDHDVDQMYDALFRNYLTHMMEDPRNITVCMHVHFMAKNVERMGDHVTSIAEQVVYLVTGEVPDEERSKMSSVSPDAPTA